MKDAFRYARAFVAALFGLLALPVWLFSIGLQIIWDVLAGDE